MVFGAVGNEISHHLFLMLILSVESVDQSTGKLVIRLRDGRRFGIALGCVP